MSLGTYPADPMAAREIPLPGRRAPEGGTAVQLDFGCVRAPLRRVVPTSVHYLILDLIFLGRRDSRENLGVAFGWIDSWG
jgi:hypothetical protein